MGKVIKPVVMLERSETPYGEEDPDLRGYQVSYGTPRGSEPLGFIKIGDATVVYQNRGTLIDNRLVLQERHGHAKKYNFETFGVLEESERDTADDLLKKKAEEVARKTRRTLYPKLEDLTVLQE